MNSCRIHTSYSPIRTLERQRISACRRPPHSFSIRSSIYQTYHLPVDFDPLASICLSRLCLYHTITSGNARVGNPRGILVGIMYIFCPGGVSLVNRQSGIFTSRGDPALVLAFLSPLPPFCPVATSQASVSKRYFCVSPTHMDYFAISCRGLSRLALPVL